MVSKAGLNFVSEVREMLDEMEVKYAPKLDERWVPERKDEILKNAPEKNSNYYVVPKVIE